MKWWGETVTRFVVGRVLGTSSTRLPGPCLFDRAYPTVSQLPTEFRLAHIPAVERGARRAARMPRQGGLVAGARAWWCSFPDDSDIFTCRWSEDDEATEPVARYP